MKQALIGPLPFRTAPVVSARLPLALSKPAIGTTECYLPPAMIVLLPARRLADLTTQFPFSAVKTEVSE